jgi:hypothetical protein
MRNPCGAPGTRNGRMAVVCARAELTPALRANPSVSGVNGPDARNEATSDLARTPTTLTEPRHTARREVPRACPPVLTRSARGARLFRT